MTAVLLLLVALQGQDPVKVGARLTDEEIHAGETTILRVDVETEGDRARIRPFRTLPPGVEVVGTRDYDQRQFSMPGGTRRFVTREFVLRAAAAGRYRIPSVEVVVDGAVYSTRSVLLTVTSAPTRPRGETRGSEDGVVLRAWLDADTVFVGEQVTLEVDAMFSQEARMRLRRAPEYEPPSPTGFWVHALPDAGRPTSRLVGGEVYEVQRFRRAFFPLAAGDYTIPPARLEYEMRRGLLYAPETRELASDPLPLVVLPIPEEQPPAFTGAVGQFTTSARLEPVTVPVGEAAVLTVEVEGTGNVKALPAPRLPELEGVDVFPPSEEAETSTRGSAIHGRKTFSWVLIPRQAGSLEIPSIPYAYFDPDTGGFETASVAPLELRATPAATGAPTAPTPTAIRFVKTTPGLDPLAWVRSSWLAALQVLPLLLLAGALAWRRGMGRQGRVSVAGLRRERRTALRALLERAGDPAETGVLAETEAFARRWLRQRLDVPTSGGPDGPTLVAAGVPEAVVSRLTDALGALSTARYAPSPPSPEHRRALVEAVGDALEALDREAPRHGARGGSDGAAGRGAAGRGAAGAVVLALVVSAGAAGPAAGISAGQDADPAAGEAVGQEDATVANESVAPEADAAELFTRGVQAFEGQRFGEAARSFDRYTTRAPADPAGWYNLGTAYHRGGHPGHGVWAWLKALELNPRDDDTRHNLRVVGVAPELVQRVTPAVPLRRSEILALLTLFWLVTGAAGAAWLLGRRRWTGAVAAAALAVTLGLAAAWWTSSGGGDTLIVLEPTSLRAGPALQAEVLSTLDPGAGLVPVDRYGNWVRARTLSGEEGWIENEAAAAL